MIGSIGRDAPNRASIVPLSFVDMIEVIGDDGAIRILMAEVGIVDNRAWGDVAALAAISESFAAGIADEWINDELIKFDGNWESGEQEFCAGIDCSGRVISGIRGA